MHGPTCLGQYPSYGNSFLPVLDQADGFEMSCEGQIALPVVYSCHGEYHVTRMSLIQCPRSAGGSGEMHWEYLKLQVPCCIPVLLLGRLCCDGYQSCEEGRSGYKLRHRHLHLKVYAELTFDKTCLGDMDNIWDVNCIIHALSICVAGIADRVVGIKSGETF
jgi:hypothetical protein